MCFAGGSGAGEIIRNVHTARAEFFPLIGKELPEEYLGALLRSLRAGLTSADCILRQKNHLKNTWFFSSKNLDNNFLAGRKVMLVSL